MALIPRVTPAQAIDTSRRERDRKKRPGTQTDILGELRRATAPQPGQRSAASGATGRQRSPEEVTASERRSASTIGEFEDGLKRRLATAQAQADRAEQRLVSGSADLDRRMGSMEERQMAELGEGEEDVEQPSWLQQTARRVGLGGVVATPTTAKYDANNRPTALNSLSPDIADENAVDLRRTLGRRVSHGEVYLAEWAGGATTAATLIRDAEQGTGDPRRHFSREFIAANRNTFFKRDGTPRSTQEVVAQRTRDFSPEPYNPRAQKASPGFMQGFGSGLGIRN